LANKSHLEKWKNRETEREKNNSHTRLFVFAKKTKNLFVTCHTNYRLPIDVFCVQVMTAFCCIKMTVTMVFFIFAKN
jgi:hypothetical protein